MKARTRIFLTLLVIVVASFALFAQWVVGDLGPRYLATMEESMVDTATLLASHIEAGMTSEEIPVEDIRKAFDLANEKRFSAPIYEVVKERLTTQAYVTNTSGVVLFHSSNPDEEGERYWGWNDVNLTLRGKYGARTTPSFEKKPGSAMLYVGAPINYDGVVVGVVTVAKPAHSVSLFLKTAKREIIIAAILAVAGLVLITAFVTYWITAPIERLTAYARSVGDNHRATPPEFGSDEVGELGRAYEEMREAVEGKQYVENYVQTLTHEMKGPLAAIRGAGELLEEDMSPEQRQRFSANIASESARIQDIVDRLLELSSIEKRKGLRDVTSIDAAQLLSEIEEGLPPSGPSLVIESDDNAVFRGERFLARQALVNLIQNALDFSPEDERVVVTAKQAGGGVRVTVLDRGPGVPDYALERIFDRFYSLPRPRTGKKSSGLGLTFAREVASLHGGTLGLENAPEGGARASIYFPRRPV